MAWKPKKASFGPLAAQNRAEIPLLPPRPAPASKLTVGDTEAKATVIFHYVA